MKKHFTNLKVAMTLLLLCGVCSAWGENVFYTLNFTKNTSASSYTTSSEVTSNDIAWDVYGNLSLGNYIRVGGKNTSNTNRTLTSKAVISKPISKISINHNGIGNGKSSSITINSITVEGSTANTFASSKKKTIDSPTVSSAGTLDFVLDEGYWDANSYYKITVNYKISGSNNCYITINTIDFYEASQSSVSTPTFTPSVTDFMGSTSVEIACATEGASIYYTLDGTEPTKASTPYTAAINISETTTIKAIAYKGDEASSVATKTYTKIIPLSTMDAIFEVATAAGNYWITFNNWVISGVNGSNAYLTDNAGKGMIIYKSSHGFAAGDILSGTVKCALTTYNGSAEVTDLASSAEGLTVTKGGTLNTIEATIADLGGVNTGAYINLGALTYNGTAFTDGTSTIKPYSTFITLPTLTNGKKYYVKGVYIQYNTTKEIAPLATTDFEEVPATKYEITITPSTNGSVTVDATDNKAQEGQVVTLTVTPENHYLLDALTVTDASSNLVTVTDNKFMMPASNVTISAEFVEKTKYQVIYANTQGFEMVYEGEKANVPVLESLRGWDFAGWTTALNYTASTTAPTLFDGTVTGNTTLVAVYKKTEAGVGNSEWRKVTSEPADWSGKYLIVFEGDVVNDVTVTPKAFNGSLTTLDAKDNGLDVTISDNVIAINSDNKDAYFTIAKSGTGYSITSESGYTIGNVLSNKGEAQNALKTGDYVNSISLEDDNSVKIGCASSTLQFNANSDQLRFRYFKSINQKPVYLYKYVTGDATTYSLYPSYTVNISSVGFATFYSKKAVTIPEGVTAYYAAYENKTITLNAVQGETIYQGEGVVLKGEEGSYEFVPTSDVLEDAPNNALFGKEVESEYADLVDDDTYVYTLNVGSNGVSFYHMAESSSLAANRAYMLIPVADFEDGAETIGFRFGDATQIENVNAVEAGKYFDLMGREVFNPAGGIYILNGKKVLVK